MAIGLQAVIDEAVADVRRERAAAAAKPLSVAAEIELLACAASCPLTGKRLAATHKSIEDARAELVGLFRKHGTAARIEQAEAWRPHLERAARR